MTDTVGGNDPVRNCNICGFPEREPHNHTIPTPTPVPVLTPFPTDPRISNLERVGHMYGRDFVPQKPKKDCCVIALFKLIFKMISDVFKFVILNPINCLRCKKKDKTDIVLPQENALSHVITEQSPNLTEQSPNLNENPNPLPQIDEHEAVQPPSENQPLPQEAENNDEPVDYLRRSI